MSTQSGTYFLGTYGFPILIKTGADLTNATAVNLSLKKPDGSAVSRDLTSAAVTNAVGGEVTYAPIQTDVTLAGVYTFSLAIPITGGRQAVADGSFTITAHLDGATILVVEDGTGVANANSYASVTEADTYHAGAIYSSEWDNQTRLMKERSLIMATRVIDQSMLFKGFKTNENQVLQWPRVRVRDRDRFQFSFAGRSYLPPYFDGNSIPKILKEGVCELARLLLVGDRTADPDSKGIASISLGQGDISIVFDKADTVRVFNDQVRMILSPLGEFKFARGSAKITRA